MAKIPLRTYNNEIETIIEQQQTEEAIAHCRHILKIFPKHIDTYRLLGKAYLECGRLGNAADIFERVLSAIPYDFVSHVGLSITSEDIGDLDKAIWHMERAFDGQPYNAAIQGELRRLYGKRDGMEPPKIHLTRSALARMYAKGDLIQQAIAELRTAIAEDPNRLDLRIFLAKMYVQTGETNKAIDSCGTILKKLPYCYDANLLLVQLLNETGRADESRAYWKRLQELDPYQAHINLHAPDKDQVQDQAVLVEQLVWDGGPAITADQPDWATSVGVKIEETDVDNFHGWLENSSESSGLFSDDAEEVVDDQEEDLIPDFMKDAGWEPSTGSFDESKTITENDGDENEIVAEAVEGELPDWLQNLAPYDENTNGEDDGTDSIGSGDSLDQYGLGETNQELNIFADDKTPQQIPDWLSELDGETESESESDGLPDWLVEEENAGETEMPDWLIPTTLGSAAIVGAVSAIDNNKNEDEELTAFEQFDDADDLITEGSTAEEPQSEIDMRSIPMVSETTESADTTTDYVDPSNLPEWLHEADIENDATQTEKSQLPDWLMDIEETPESSVQVEESLPDQIPDWLVEIIDDESQLEEVEQTIQEEVSQPEWPRDTVGDQEEPESQALIDAISNEHETVLEEELGPSIPDSDVDHLDEAREIVIDQDVPNEVESISSEDIDRAVIEEFDDIGFDQLAEEAIVVEESDIPGWFQEVVESEEGLQEVIDQAPILQTEEELIQPNKDDQDSALVWLETIALAQEVLDDEVVEEPNDVQLEKIDNIATPEDTSAIQQPSLGGEAIIDDETATSDMIVESDLDMEETSKEYSEGDQQIKQEEILVEQDTSLVLDNEQLLGNNVLSESMEENSEYSTIEVDDVKEFQTQTKEDADETPVELDTPIEITTIDVDDTDIGFTWLDEIEPEQVISDGENQMSSEIESDEPIPEIPAENMREPELSDDLTLLGEVVDTGTSPTTQEGSDEPDFGNVDAALAWLEGLAAKQGTSEDELLTRPEDRSETPPEWLQEDTHSDGIVESDIDFAQTSIIEETSNLESENAQTTEGDQSDLFVESGEVDTAIESSGVIEDVDDAMAWLESLAAKQGVSEDELLTTPSERSETPPEWIFKSENIDTVKDGQEQESEAADLLDDETPYTPPAWVTDGQVPEDEDLSWLPTEENEDEKELLDLNQASLIQLERLPGIGFRKAQSITAYREEHGEFRNLDALMNVPGMDHETLELLKTRVTLKVIDDTKWEGDATQQEDIYDHFIDEPDDENHERQLAARSKLNSGSIEEAMDEYQKLIQNGQRQDAVIDDLEIAAEKYPDEVAIWQTLGDAYMKSDRLQDAMEAYTKAQNLLD